MGKSLGNRLYSLRCSFGYSQAYIASRLNVKTDEYKLVEKDKFVLTNDQLFELCNLFGIDDLFS